MNEPPVRPQFAIALQYDGDGAPRVTAKGGGELAEEILALARDAGIPLEEDALLTDALARVDLGKEIPPALYLAVAEVLAFAYLVSGKAPPRPPVVAAGAAAGVAAGAAAGAPPAGETGALIEGRVLSPEGEDRYLRSAEPDEEGADGQRS